MSSSAWSDIDKAEQMARDALAGKMRGDLPSWYWPEGTIGLVEEVRRLRQVIEEIADDNSPHDAQLGACFVAEQWRA